MLAHADVSTLDAIGRSVSCSDVRSLEVDELMQAIAALHRADILTGAEFEAKRQQLAACR